MEKAATRHGSGAAWQGSWRASRTMTGTMTERRPGLHGAPAFRGTAEWPEAARWECVLSCPTNSSPHTSLVPLATGPQRSACPVSLTATPPRSPVHSGPQAAAVLHCPQLLRAEAPDRPHGKPTSPQGKGSRGLPPGGLSAWSQTWGPDAQSTRPTHPYLPHLGGASVRPSVAPRPPPHTGRLEQQHTGQVPGGLGGPPAGRAADQSRPPALLGVLPRAACPAQRSPGHESQLIRVLPPQAGQNSQDLRHGQGPPWRWDFQAAQAQRTRQGKAATLVMRS